MDKVFAKGFSAKRNEKAPDWHLCRIGIKVEEAIQFLNEHSKGGYVNISVNMGKSGNPYCELDTYEPKPKEEKPEKPTYIKEPSDDLPF